jgi:hypothetical protein
MERLVNGLIVVEQLRLKCLYELSKTPLWATKPAN